VVLLRRTVFRPRLKWILAGLALAPKILFAGVRLMTAPAELAFVIEQRSLANSPALWSWSILLAALGIVILTVPIEGRNRQEFPPAQPERSSSPSPLIRLVGLVRLAAAVIMLLEGSQTIFSALKTREKAGGRSSTLCAARSPGSGRRMSRLSKASPRRGADPSTTPSRSNSRMAGPTPRPRNPPIRSWTCVKFAVTADLRPSAVHLHPYFGSD
jgi:hypothetical protein